MRERGPDAPWVPATVKAVLEALDEVGVSVGVKIEKVDGGLPPGGDRHVVPVLPRPLDRYHVEPVEAAETPVRLLLLAGHCQGHVEAMPRRELARVFDDHAHAAGKLEVL